MAVKQFIIQNRLPFEIITPKENEAMAADDAVALDHLLAPEFTLTHMTGYVQPRAEWLRELRLGTMHYFSAVEDHVEMVATATGWHIVGQNRVTASIHGGGKHVWPLNTVLVVERLDGRWQIMSVVATMY
ncbi:nuclear transport factor 2 family protein [Levilactobacillus enshiensis]|uniref:nuclear transport factor 2 family protein n=1 Tax=Levilactobacillus enshiensis TaxID=2590213 RepID=UPI00131ABBF7|nr:nuclear transport factor 2 family protein [Levilactobacillus enshiensis]